MKKLLLVPVIAFSSIPSFAAKIKNPTCQDVVELNYTLTPQYMAVLDGYNRRGKSNDQVDFAGIVTESKEVTDECAKDKSAKIKTIRKAILKTAATDGNSDKGKTTINPTKAKCSDFIALDEQYQPVAAFWVAGHSKAGKVSDGEIDEEYLERPVAALIEECKATPTASFYGKTKAWLRKHI